MTVTAFRFPDAPARYKEALQLLNDPTVTDPYSRAAYWNCALRARKMILEDAESAVPSDCEPKGA